MPTIEQLNAMAEATSGTTYARLSSNDAKREVMALTLAAGLTSTLGDIVTTLDRIQNDVSVIAANSGSK